MQAAVVNVLGEAPKYQSFPDPEVQPGEVLVKVRAAGLHQVVKAIASGAHYSSGGGLPGAGALFGLYATEQGVFFVDDADNMFNLLN